MINELLHKYKNQEPKSFGEHYRERCYPVSAVIAMLEEQKQALSQHDVIKNEVAVCELEKQTFNTKNGYEIKCPKCGDFSKDKDFTESLICPKCNFHLI